MFLGSVHCIFRGGLQGPLSVFVDLMISARAVTKRPGINEGVRPRTGRLSGIGAELILSREFLTAFEPARLTLSLLRSSHRLSPVPAFLMDSSSFAGCQ